MKPIVALAVGIIIGAGGMWFMQKSSEKTLQVDEVIESYSTPMTGDNQGQTAPAPAHTPAPTTTGSNQHQMNLSDATPTDGTDGSQESTTDSNSQTQGGY
jgi:hypothetical protein